MITACDYATISAIETECLGLNPTFHVYQGDDESAEYRATVDGAVLVSQSFPVPCAGSTRLAAVAAFRDQLTAIVP
ncbi:MAG: hypothetical protein BGO98_29580 [Myxococcales bacterium 68-20]|nr:hypothetical protein [Myxococcales bacterium]OJY30911.1 MAG: hypothetical protein BGO98_29580 [Myxococcales bacterium 68-20]